MKLSAIEPRDPLQLIQILGSASQKKGWRGENRTGALPANRIDFSFKGKTSSGFPVIFNYLVRVKYLIELM